MTRSFLVIPAVALSLGLVAGRAAADALPSDKLPEPPIVDKGADKVAGPDGEYLRTLHAHVHKRWTDNFLRLIGEKLPSTNPLNDASKAAEVELTISPDGLLVASQIVKASGFPGFDDAVMDVVRDSVPFPKPPQSARSDDDKLHVHWLFARDQRRCSGLELLRVQDPLEIAIPKLLRAGRAGEVLARVGAARAAGIHAEPMMSTLAMEWMKLAAHEPWLTARMARLLAATGDADAIAWLKLAVKRPETARDAGEALVASKVAVCPLVKASFDSQNWADHQVAAQALATAGEPACVPGLVKLLENSKARPEARVAAAVALGAVEDDAAKKALTAAKEDPNTAVRGAAMLAQVRPNSGRRQVLAMVSFLRDASPDLRAAAAAGVVRAGGDSNLADLYVLFKETDARPLLATLNELDRLGSEQGLALVGKLAKRPQLPVEKLAAEILIRHRSRANFSALKGYLEGNVDRELHGLALVAADDGALAAAAGDPKLGMWPYRAYLARGERDQAADWMLSRAGKMPAAAQGEMMADWLGTTEPHGTATADARKPKR